jgi:hypothetical protein
MKYLDARSAGKKIKSPLPTRGFRELRVTWKIDNPFGRRTLAEHEKEQEVV